MRNSGQLEGTKICEKWGTSEDSKNSEYRNVGRAWHGERHGAMATAGALTGQRYVYAGATGVCMACRTQGCSAKGARERGFDIERASDEGATDFDKLGYQAHNCQLTVMRHTVEA